MGRIGTDSASDSNQSILVAQAQTKSWFTIICNECQAKKDADHPTDVEYFMMNHVCEPKR